MGIFDFWKKDTPVVHFEKGRFSAIDWKQELEQADVRKFSEDGVSTLEFGCLNNGLCLYFLDNGTGNITVEDWLPFLNHLAQLDDQVQVSLEQEVIAACQKSPVEGWDNVTKQYQFYLSCVDLSKPIIVLDYWGECVNSSFNCYAKKESNTWCLYQDWSCLKPL